MRPLLIATATWHLNPCPPPNTRAQHSKAKKALKADVKKGTALVKRVTALSDEALPAVLADVAGFNLTRYSSEVRQVALMCACRD